MSDLWVIDACTAAKWWLKEERFADEAMMVLKAVRDEKIEPAVPDLWFYELANVFVQAYRRKRLTREQTETIIREVQEMPVRSYSLQKYIPRIKDLAIQYALSAYDAAYLALAETLQCRLLTADDSLFNSIREHIPLVRHIRETEQLFSAP